jgi:predicted nucleic acid-binding protein
VGLILDSSLLIADEREAFDVAAWLRSRPPEPVGVSAITQHDLIIAATAMSRRWTVATFNLHEFQPVPGLKVIKP